VIDRIFRESLRAMATFRNALLPVSGRKSRKEAPRLEEMKRLLSPFVPGENALLDQIYPERAFPALHALGFPAGSWLAALLDMAAVETQTRRDPEVQLAGALRLSAMALAAAALLREIAGAPPEEMDLPLPEFSAPLLLLVSDDGGFPDDGREGPLKEIETACRGEVWICKLSHMAQLPALGRKIHDRWGIPASMSGSVAVVASSSMIHGLGALALGFSLAAVPAYPIHGSLRVENYLTRHLKETFGHAYLSVRAQEDIVGQILGGLKR
jgi:hypothetical protein